MDRIGATHWEDQPPRPKYMHRRTYELIQCEILGAPLRAFKTVLGRDDYEAGVCNQSA